MYDASSRHRRSDQCVRGPDYLGPTNPSANNARLRILRRGNTATQSNVNDINEIQPDPY